MGGAVVFGFATVDAAAEDVGAAAAIGGRPAIGFRSVARALSTTTVFGDTAGTVDGGRLEMPDSVLGNCRVVKPFMDIRRARGARCSGETVRASVAASTALRVGFGVGVLEFVRGELSTSSNTLA